MSLLNKIKQKKRKFNNIFYNQNDFLQFTCFVGVYTYTMKGYNNILLFLDFFIFYIERINN